MAQRQQALSEVVLKDPAVASLSSFIGVDGVNTTLNSGRVLINLKPLSERGGVTATEVIRLLQQRLASFEGIVLYMQPVQDLTIEDQVSRTQYQFSVSDADPVELGQWVPRLVERLRGVPQLADVVSDIQDEGLQAYVEIDRATAGRLGLRPHRSTTRSTNAFGQRLISTIYTQTSQYRVVLEVKPEFKVGPASLEDIYIGATGGGAPVNFRPWRVWSKSPPNCKSATWGSFRRRPFPSTWRPRASLGEAVDAIRAAEQEIAMPLSVQTRFQARRSRSRGRSTTRCS